MPLCQDRENTAMPQAFSYKVREDLKESCPLGRFANTGEVAEAVIFSLSDGAKHITEEIVDVYGGMFMD